MSKAPRLAPLRLSQHEFTAKCRQGTRGTHNGRTLANNGLFKCSDAWCTCTPDIPSNAFLPAFLSMPLFQSLPSFHNLLSRDLHGLTSTTFLAASGVQAMAPRTKSDAWPWTSCASSRTKTWIITPGPGSGCIGVFYLPSFLSSFLFSFLSSFLPSSLPCLLPCILPCYLASLLAFLTCLPPCLPTSFPSFRPSVLPNLHSCLSKKITPRRRALHEAAATEKTG